jgi:hypothetical protein
VRGNDKQLFHEAGLKRQRHQIGDWAKIEPENSATRRRSAGTGQKETAKERENSRNTVTLAVGLVARHPRKTCRGYQSPQAPTLYTKVAKSAKKELEVVRSFALFATLV